VIVEGILQKAQKCEVDKQQKMLLSLMSNSQTMKPYIQEMIVYAPGQSITCSTAYCSTYGSPFVSRIAIT